MKTYRFLALTLILLAGLPAMAIAQSVTASLKTLHGITVNFITQTAETLDEDMYAFRPTEGVRTAGQILAHIADSQFAFCSVAADEESPAKQSYEETAKTKADIVAALKAGFDYCGKVYDESSDEDGTEVVDLFGMKLAASAVLAFNSAHNYEHYGNLVTYMRIKGIVPPSSR